MAVARSSYHPSSCSGQQCEAYLDGSCGSPGNRLEPSDLWRTCTGLPEVVFLLGYIGTVFLYRLIFIRFYAAASEEVQAQSRVFPRG